MHKYKIVNISKMPKFQREAAEWFHAKWKVPVDLYQKSITESLKLEKIIPSWYLCIVEDKIIGGAGVIENDFHNRKDLAPNVCALYIEENYRCQGIAGKLLSFICEDMKSKGINSLYLLTNHTNFYERYDWKFLCMVQSDDGEMLRMYIYDNNKNS